MRTVPRRILIVRPSAFGDVCRTVPLLWSLRAAFPNSVIDWVVEDVWAPAIREHPALNGVIQFPKREFRACWRDLPTAWKTLQWFFQLRRSKYDVVIDAQGLARSGLMSWITGAPVRVGNRAGREFSWLAANRRVVTPKGTHVVDAMLQLVREVGAESVANMGLVVPAADRQWWSEEMERRRIGGAFAAIAITNGWEGKRWIEDRWEELLAALADDFLAKGIRDLVWIGAPGEERQVEAVVGRVSLDARLRSHNMVGKTSVGSTMAIIQRASLVVGLDSAPTHLAVGLGVPFVALYGATQPAKDGPYQLQSWCIHGGRGTDSRSHDYRDPQKGRKMMERISVEEVAALIRKRLQAKDPS